ncbi:MULTISPECIES: hypothetical protein [Francisella]|nr:MULTISPECIES: hypothetical protein [Francisella]
MKLKKVLFACSIAICCISLNSCILKLPFQIVGDVIDDITPF